MKPLKKISPKVRETSKEAVHTASRPFVLVNMAMTADGKIATANRAVSSFGSRRDHNNLLALRATVDAVMSGARTVDLNLVNLGPGGKKYQKIRLQRGLAEFNLRIIVSGSGTINPNAEIFKQTFSPIIILTTARGAGKLRQLLHLPVEIIVCGKREIDFPAALILLKEKFGVQRLICEGGGELNDALFRAGLVDELHLTICPKIYGGRQAPTISDGTGFAQLSQAAQFEVTSMRKFGEEIFLIYQHSLRLPAKPVTKK